MKHIFLIVLFLCGAANGQWEKIGVPTTANLRGVSVVNENVVWASGTAGTVVRTVDGGKTWSVVIVPGAEKLDFRGIRAFDDKIAFVLAVGPGEKSRIYKTTDGGQHWQLQFTNQEPKAFYDCFAFWDRQHGISFSDSVEGQFLLLSTSDGRTWRPLVPALLPPAVSIEGAFAASDTCIAAVGKQDVWFVTGGPAARVFHSSDQGQTWKVVNSPILSGGPTQGIFSITFWDKEHGVIVGGDYQNPKNTEKNAAVTADGGNTWMPATKGPSGYRSAVAFTPGTRPPVLVAVGITGSDYSLDGGKTWQPMDAVEYNAVGFAGPAAGWAVGPHGRVAHFINIPGK